MCLASWQAIGILLFSFGPSVFICRHRQKLILSRRRYSKSGANFDPLRMRWLFSFCIFREMLLTVCGMFVVRNTTVVSKVLTSKIRVVYQSLIVAIPNIFPEAQGLIQQQKASFTLPHSTLKAKR